jgi:hypothetical protein
LAAALDPGDLGGGHKSQRGVESKSLEGCNLRGPGSACFW